MKIPKANRVNLKKMKKIRKKKKYTNSRKPLIVINKGKDVIYNMNTSDGIWKGTRTSEMALTHDGRNLLKWIVSKDFDKEAVAIIEDQLEVVPDVLPDFTFEIKW